jgi:hypothetical protein
MVAGLLIDQLIGADLSKDSQDIHGWELPDFGSK